VRSRLSVHAQLTMRLAVEQHDIAHARRPMYLDWL
jgi:hypothetical protein